MWPKNKQTIVQSVCPPHHPTNYLHSLSSFATKKNAGVDFRKLPETTTVVVIFSCLIYIDPWPAEGWGWLSTTQECQPQYTPGRSWTTLTTEGYSPQFILLGVIKSNIIINYLLYFLGKCLFWSVLPANCPITFCIFIISPFSLVFTLKIVGARCLRGPSST